MARPVFLSHPSSLGHDTGVHPESSRRIAAINTLLERQAWLGYEHIISPAVDRVVLERVHPRAHIDTIARFAQRGGGMLDADTVLSPGSYDAALHACGGAVELVNRLVTGGNGQVGFSAHRPPGHHAEAVRAMGFCLFNNVAVAARHAVDGLGLRRVLILDWDVHHGNGTQEIFWDDARVLFISIHQSPLYPGGGAASEMGGDSALGHTINLPVPPRSGDKTFVSLVRDVAVPLARAYRPELILISAGYDAHVHDPLADCDVSDSGYAAMTALVRDLGIPVGCVLEGGYDVDVLARCVALTMETLAGGGRPEQFPSAELDRIRVHRLAVEARARLAPLWPDITSRV